MISAEVIADSIGEKSPRLTTFKLRYPKFIHGEFMTHRAFSRNASSSRAVPVSKNLEEVRSDELRAGPLYWGAEQKGMQSGAELDDEFDCVGGVIMRDKPLPPAGRFGSTTPYPGRTQKALAEIYWRYAVLDAAQKAENLHVLGAHKSIVNRILEPFLHINVVMTSCEPGLLNFFGLRLDKAAQPEMRMLAEAMWRAWNKSLAIKLATGEWHLPFVEPSDFDTRIARIELGEQLKRISVARCARVSYESFTTRKRSSVEEDMQLYARLVEQRHYSPFEHQATPDQWICERYKMIYGPSDYDGEWEAPRLHGNLPGWRQYRKHLADEDQAHLPEGYERKQDG